MNSKIRELMEQAMELVDPYALEGEFGPRQLNEEKFAELIVRECMEQIGDAIPDTNCSAADAYKTARIAATSRVKQHFGVEE